MVEEMFGGRGRPAMGSTAVGVCFRERRSDRLLMSGTADYTLTGVEFLSSRVSTILLSALLGRGKSVATLSPNLLEEVLTRLPLDPHVKRLNVSDEEQLLCVGRINRHANRRRYCSELFSVVLSDPANALVSAALDEGGVDNITVIVIDRVVVM